MIVSVSGLGWSGSGAVYDLLKEYDDLKIALEKSIDPEFGLIADVDGIRDLEYHLTEKSTRIASYVAILRFMELVRAHAAYFRYDNDFGGNFVKSAEEYIDTLVDFQFKGSTYYELFNLSEKTKRRNYLISKWLGNRYARLVLKDLYKKLLIDIDSIIKVSYKPTDFLNITQNYLDGLFSHIDNPENLPLVFDQMIPPDNPEQYIKYLKNPKCIFVRRDPRDTYIFVKQANDSSISIPSNTVDNFICFYKKIIQDTIRPNNEHFLNIRFEDLIYKYDDTISEIEAFLGISKHTRQYEKLNPKVSIKNTQLFDRYPEYAEDVKKIEQLLPDSLYPFEYKNNIDRNALIF